MERKLILLKKYSQKRLAEIALVKKIDRIVISIQKCLTKGDNLLLLWPNLTGLDSHQIEFVSHLKKVFLKEKNLLSLVSNLAGPDSYRVDVRPT